MKKRLYSYHTYVFIFVPLIFFIFVALSSIISFFNSQDLTTYLGIFFFNGIFLITLYYASKLKFVHIDQQYLYVANYKKKIKIELDNIKHVKDYVLFSPRLLKIDFFEETGFGMDISFFAYTEPFLFFKKHPAGKTIINNQKEYFDNNK